jgi:hypothetical protein
VVIGATAVLGDQVVIGTLMWFCWDKATLFVVGTGQVVRFHCCAGRALLWLGQVGTSSGAVPLLCCCVGTWSSGDRSAAVFLLGRVKWCGSTAVLGRSSGDRSTDVLLLGQGYSFCCWDGSSGVGPLLCWADQVVIGPLTCCCWDKATLFVVGTGQVVWFHCCVGPIKW